MENIEEEDYNPYCKICGGCGEDGCCSALRCKFEDGCEYKQTYLNDLREGYIFMKEFYEKLYDKLDDDLKKEVDELYMSIEV
jgi:hypothetical protein